jgi:alkaline phosphatase D
MPGQLDRIDRRAFLRGGAATAAGIAAAKAGSGLDMVTAAGKTRARPVRGARFEQGVASGEPGARGMTLWTKLSEVDRPGTLTLEVARDRGFDRVVERRRITARRRFDYAVKQRVGGLKPNERYYYRFDAGDRSSPVGTFKTLPAPGSRTPVRIAVFSCQAWEAGFYTPHAALAKEEDLDLVVCLGDYIYERVFYDEDPVREDKLGKNGDGEVQTLREYRDKYALYHGDRNLRAVRQAHPMLAIWDDHEVEDNYAGKLAGDATQDKRVRFLKRRRNGYRAFFEHMPFTNAGGSRRKRDRFRIYRSVRVGKHVELLLLDQRQYRDDQPCNDELPPTPPCSEEELNDPNRTFLGRRQKRWLKRRLAASDATWKLVANQAMAMSIDVPATNPVNMDQWDGYAFEREDILTHVADRGIDNVAFLTGDIHTFFAGDVSPTGRQTAASTPAAVATEFVTGSVTSLGIPETVAAISGAPLPPELLAVLADGGAIQSNNPHIKYADTERRGYGVVEATGDELEVRYRAVESTMERRSQTFDLERFVVQSGTPAVQVG